MKKPANKSKIETMHCAAILAVVAVFTLMIDLDARAFKEVIKRDHEMQRAPIHAVVFCVVASYTRKAKPGGKVVNALTYDEGVTESEAIKDFEEGSKYFLDDHNEKGDKMELKRDGNKIREIIGGK